VLLRGRERLGRSVRELLLLREPPCSHGMHLEPHFTSSLPQLLTGERLGRSVRELLLLREPPCSHGMHLEPHFTSSLPQLLTGERLGRSVRELLLLLLLLLERLGTVGTVGTVVAECVLKTLSTAALLLRGRRTLGRSLLALLLLEITSWAAG